MGWFDGLFGGSSAADSADPLAKLDPKVREFLEKESPIKYQPAAAAVTAEPAAASPSPQQAKAVSPTSASDKASPAAPSESLFQDGRYAHLWKTYRPLAEVEAETKTDHERLMDVLDAYKDRRVQIGRAALENCALEQLDWNTCMKEGPVSSRMTMCHEEMKKFERCYNMQSRLLKALGYLSTYDRSPELDEQVQIHADTLYHRMIDQEAAIEKAKAEGLPPPAWTPVVGSTATMTKTAATATAATTAATAAAATVSSAPTPTRMAPIKIPDLPEDLRQQFEEKLAKLPENERPAEEAAMLAELQARTELGNRVAELRAAQIAAREQRKAEGKLTIKDRVAGIFGGK